MNICLNNKPQFASMVFTRPGFLAFCECSHQLSPVQRRRHEGEAAAHTHINTKMVSAGGVEESSLWCSDLPEVAGYLWDFIKISYDKQA